MIRAPTRNFCEAQVARVWTKPLGVSKLDAFGWRPRIAFRDGLSATRQWGLERQIRWRDARPYRLTNDLGGAQAPLFR